MVNFGLLTAEIRWQVWGTPAYFNKNNGEIAPGVPPQAAKTCFLLSMQRGLSATYPAPISTIFETSDVNR